MGIALKHQGKLDEAIEAFKKAVSLKPDFADGYNNIGVALQDQGKLDEAIVSFNKAIRIKPDYAEAYNHMNCLQKSRKAGRSNKGLHKSTLTQA